MDPNEVEARHGLYLSARMAVARDYRTPLTLERLARALSSSPRQLQRVYEQAGETTFREDLLARRMTAAADLLVEQHHIPVADVARLVGYAQASHFARVFRLHFGLAPARFRAAARATEAERG
jgi:transcriptional regulator GlxA family with amidase domain